MKKLLALVVVLSALWSGYWFVGASGVRAGFESWFEARRTEGWQAEYSDLAVNGFPNRFDTTLTNPALADPHTGLAWQAPFLQIFALSYRPNHIIAVFPNSQTVSTPRARYSLASADMRASMVMEPQSDLAFNRANLTSEALLIRNSDGAETKLSGLQAALRREAGARYRLAINADGLAPPSPEAFSLSGDLPDTLSTLRADATLAFSKPWDISALEAGRPQPREIKLHLAEAKWGALELAAAGTLLIDRAGTPTGEITIKARNWRDILTLAQSSGALPEALARQIEQGLTLLSQLSGNAETLDIPLTFKSGMIRLGPVPLGPAPRLYIR